MARVAQTPVATPLAAANHEHVSAAHSAGSSAAAPQQGRQAAAASRDKAERRGSNVPRCAPSQAVLARKLTPLQRWAATRHLTKDTGLDTLVLHSHDHKQSELYYAANPRLQVLHTL